MMSAMQCNRCSAEIALGTRFCRQCGQPVTPEPVAGSEDATRTLGTQPPGFGAALTGQIDPRFTGPAYLSPGQSTSSQFHITCAKQSHLLRNLILIGVAAVALIMIPAIAYMKMVLFRSVPSHSIKIIGPVATEPSVTIAPAPPGGPVPPAAPGTTNSELVYPGSEVRVDIAHGKNNRVLQLHTEDSFEKVLAWYMDRIKPSKVVKQPPYNAVLKSDKVKGVITNSGDGTDVVIKQSAEADDDSD
jgi:hypothetical protein